MNETETMYKQKVRVLRQNIDELTREKEYLKNMNDDLLDLSVMLVLKAGINYDSHEYQHIVAIAGIRRIILTKINYGYVLTEKEKEYLNNNLK